MESQVLVGLLRGLIGACERASAQETETGVQSRDRWSAVLRARELSDALGADLDDASIFAIAKWTPPTVDHSKPVPGSRTVYAPFPGYSQEPLAVRKRPTVWRGSHVGGGYEVVRGTQAYSTRGHNALLPVQWIALLSVHDTEEEAISALDARRAEESPS